MDFIDALLLRQIPRNPGTAVFVSPLGGVDAPSFVRYLARTKRLAKQVLFATLKVELVPHVPCNEQASFVDRGDGVLMATIRFGYCDEPDIPRALTSAAALRWDPATTRYCITREPGDVGCDQRMPPWQRWLFLLMSRACIPAAQYLRLPRGRTVELAAEGHGVGGTGQRFRPA